MSRVLVVYTTTLGNTGRMARSVADGARSVPGAEVTLREATAATSADARACDALILGSPVRHRSADARVKGFIERVIEQLWLTDELVGKVGACFTVGGGYGDCASGAELTQAGLCAALTGAGMLFVPLPKTTPGYGAAGTQWGPHGRSGAADMTPTPLSDDMLAAAYHHGANVARIAAALRGQPELFARGNVAPDAELLRKFQQPTG